MATQAVNNGNYGGATDTEIKNNQLVLGWKNKVAIRPHHGNPSEVKFPISSNVIFVKDNIRHTGLVLEIGICLDLENHTTVYHIDSITPDIKLKSLWVPEDQLSLGVSFAVPQAPPLKNEDIPETQSNNDDIVSNIPLTYPIFDLQSGFLLNSLHNNGDPNTTTTTSNNSPGNAIPLPPHPNTSSPPQLAYGWWLPYPPPVGPYFWPCLPQGYTLTPANGKTNTKWTVGTPASMEAAVAEHNDKKLKKNDGNSMVSKISINSDTPKKMKSRTPTTKFTPEQNQVLHEYFLQDRHPTAAVSQKLAEQTGLTSHQVKIWFQNHRARSNPNRNKMLQSPEDSQGTPPDTSMNSETPRSPPQHLASHLQQNNVLQHHQSILQQHQTLINHSPQSTTIHNHPAPQQQQQQQQNHANSIISLNASTMPHIAPQQNIQTIAHLSTQSEIVTSST